MTNHLPISTPKYINTSTHRIAIFASGSGTNAEEIMKRFQHHASIEVVMLLSNNARAFALERAKKFNVSSKVFDRPIFRESEEVLSWLKEKNVTHIVLAGFMWLVPSYLIKSFPGKIINIHPALLPKFGGKGMYGMHVHEAVKAAGEKQTGITIHEVNEKYDEGRILFQAKTQLSTSDTPDDIAKKVHMLEYEHYPRVIEEWILDP
ncbi:MAG TPA: phosphoribosylglycinamide formyltransferase [Cyclobacteriaceae bacterium]|nr:phosphoribosylglycinamide formyltransferase [Cyclobacteriaceae bacterium]